MVANTRWLTALEDVPGEYLAARIAMEYKRRKKLGLTPPEPEDPE
jgi:Ca-activated chloride channel family protein